ncbi:Tat pathway signal protein [Nitrosospira lacus]|nr:Tat pathway signal protein [Nitrosospira lacus]
MTPPVPEQLVDAMAARACRMHYYLWHEIRDNWVNYPKDLQDELRKAGWEPPRPALDENGEPFVDNGSGEDYLYMHRQTIQYANKILARAGDPNYRRIEGWLEIPSPDDPDFPVPAPWFDPGEFPVVIQFMTRSKTELTFQKYLKPWENMFTDPGFLKDISLGMLGALIHTTVHDTVKRRWSAVPGARRPEPGPEVETIPVEWDDPRYNYLPDFYSMQVNPVYWKFYGWVDDRIESWKVVHCIFGSNFWQGKWMGKIPDAGEGAPAGLYERLEDPAVANTHAAETEHLLLTIGRRLASGNSPA